MNSNTWHHLPVEKHPLRWKGDTRRICSMLSAVFAHNPAVVMPGPIRWYGLKPGPSGSSTLRNSLD
jgi:hypothetical protein